MTALIDRHVDIEHLDGNTILTNRFTGRVTTIKNATLTHESRLEGIVSLNYDFYPEIAAQVSEFLTQHGCQNIVFHPSVLSFDSENGPVSLVHRYAVYTDGKDFFSMSVDDVVGQFAIEDEVTWEYTFNGMFRVDYMDGYARILDLCDEVSYYVGIEAVKMALELSDAGESAVLNTTEYRTGCPVRIEVRPNRLISFGPRTGKFVMSDDSRVSVY